MNGGNGREHADRAALRERLSAYLDGELAPDDAAALERHLAACAECRDELAALREVRTLLRALPSPALPRSFALPAAATTQPSLARQQPARPPRAAAVGTRLPPTASPRRVHALARAAQWVGGLAAACGLFLIVTTALLGGGFSHSSNMAAAPAGGASHMPQHASSTAREPATTTATTTPGGAAGFGPTHTPDTTTAPTTPGVTGAPATTTATPSVPGPVTSVGPTAEPFPVLPVAGGGLLAGGIVLLGVGSAAARKRQRGH